MDRKPQRMDFTERYFGYSPDYGDGPLEIAILPVSFMAVVALALWLFKQR